MYRYILLIILSIPLLLYAEESFFVTFENEDGKSINKIHYTVSGSKQGAIKDETTRISILQFIFPGKNYFRIQGEFDKWLKNEDLTITFSYEKKDIKLESRLPLKKKWFKNGFKK